MLFLHPDWQYFFVAQKFIEIGQTEGTPYSILVSMALILTDMKIAQAFIL